MITFFNPFPGKQRLFILLLLVLMAMSCAVMVEPSSQQESPTHAQAIDFSEKVTWAFQPSSDRYDQKALLDLRYLNEKVAGESGFIHLSSDGRDFVKGDGTPIRFWAVNSAVWQQGEAAPLEDNARFLAKRGVNMVRWHGQIAPKAEDSQLTDIDEQARQQLWQYVAGMKQAGIYLTLSPYYANTLQPQPKWGIPRDSENLNSLLFFDPKLQEAYKSWLRSLFEPVNPYTGIALKDDPAIAIIQLQNEDSLLFWTVSQLKGRDLDLLSHLFADWLEKKYGSLPKASAAWQNESIQEDNFAQGLIGLYNVWEMTQPQQQNSGKAKRLADQTQFWTETMHRFNTEMTRFLREEIGAKSLINAGNWKTADPVRLNDAERYSYTASEVIGVNRYYNGLHEGENSGWAIVNGDKFTDPSVLFDPDSFPLNLKQVTGHPIIIPESSWVPPLSYQSEGPFLVSVFQSLTGIDGFYWFSMGEPQWRLPSSANGFLPSLGKWVVNTPELLGNFPAASLMYRQGYIRQGQPIIAEKRSLNELWERQLPLIAETRSFDPNRDREGNGAIASLSKKVNPLAFLVGPVEVSYDTDSSQSQVLDLKAYIDEKAKVVRSITGEITWDYGQGICELNTPKAQGVTGFLGKRGEIKLGDSAIASGNEYATVLLVSMDGKPLTQSQKILVQVGTMTRPTGWQQKEVTWKDEQEQPIHGFEVVNYGQAPWRLINNNLRITVNNPQLTQGTFIDPNGLEQSKVSLKRDRHQVSFSFPPNAKYLILQ